MELHRTDEEAVKRILMVETVPENVAEACMKRLLMHSRAGCHQPLGLVTISEILTRLGYESPPLERRPIGDSIDWNNIPAETKVAVDMGDILGVLEGVFTGNHSIGGYDVLVPSLEIPLRICTVKQLSLDLKKLDSFEEKTVKAVVEKEEPERVEPTPEVETDNEVEDSTEVEEDTDTEDTALKDELSSEEIAKIFDRPAPAYEGDQSFWDDVISGTPVSVKMNSNRAMGKFLEIEPDGRMILVAMDATDRRPGYERRFHTVRVSLLEDALSSD